MTGPKRKATRRDVAQLAGVAPATVSFVLNGQANQVRLAEETRQRVLAAARELNYLPNPAARALAGHRHRTIGIIAVHPVGSLHVPAFEDFAVAAIERASTHQHFVVFLPLVKPATAYDPLFMLRGAQVDGLILSGAQTVHELAPRLAQLGLPVICVDHGDHRLGNATAAHIAIDGEQAGRMLAGHLLEKGHRKIAMLFGPAHQSGHLGARFQAFEHEITHSLGSGTTLVPYAIADWSAEAGYWGMQELLANDRSITAVFAGNDFIATGVMRAVREQGRSIPQDIAVVGFGDFRMSAYLDPPLTTVRWPLGELGARAVDLLIAQLTGDGSSTGSIVLPTELLVRASS